MEKIDKIIKTVYLRGQIDSESTSEAIATILSPEENDILLVINSGGGDAHDGIALLDAIKWSQKNVSALAIGKCFSMAFNIFVCCKKRFSFENTFFMTHGVATNLDGRFNHHDINTFLDQHQKLDQKLVKDIVKHSKIKEKFLRDAINSKKDVFFTAEEGMKLRFVDRIVKKPNDLLNFL
jgi:ATP-dependent protease ClpP protease subunit